MSPQQKKKPTISERWRIQRGQYDRDFFLELLFVYLAVTYVIIQAFEVSTLDAALWAPLVLVGGFVGLYVVVVAVGFVLNGLDRVKNLLK